MSGNLKFLYSLFVEALLVVLLVTVGLHLFLKNNLSNITKHYAEVTATTGGFTKTQYDNMLEELRIYGFPEDSISINIRAIGPDGTDYSDIVKNVTPPSEDGIYEQTPVYCPRSTEIFLEIKSTKNSFLGNFYKSIGLDSNLKKGTSRRVYMSERVK